MRIKTNSKRQGLSLTKMVILLRQLFAVVCSVLLLIPFMPANAQWVGNVDSPQGSMKMDAVLVYITPLWCGPLEDYYIDLYVTITQHGT